jgi:iron(III) transport system ATP-binding protein
MALKETNGRTSDVPAARVCGVSKHYAGGVVAVRDVSFEVKQGELLTLLGPSGCGKTTTMRSIAGLERITSGEIYLRERVVSSTDKRIHLAPEKRDVGMVFQSYAIWPHMSVFENVAYPLRCRRMARAEIRERVRAGLKMVDMEDYEERPATKLSGGQQQRVALARCLVMRPSVLLLDEPLSNLDAKLRGQMRHHIKYLQEQTGLTMVYVTHDQVEAMALSDRIIVMNGGVIEQSGTPEEIYERPRSEFVADFVGAINFFWGEVTAVDQQRNLLWVKTGAETLAGTLDEMAPPAVGSRVLMVIRPEKITVVDARGGLQATDSINSIPATVMTNTFCGDHREMSVETQDFTARIQSASTVAAARGADVQLEFAAADLHLLQRREAGVASAGRGNSP